MRITLPLIALIGTTVGLGACTARREVVVVERPAPRPPVEVVERNGWFMLGDRVVEGNYDHDTIHVGGREGRFNRLVFEVENHAVEIFDVRVTFGDGSFFDVPTRLVFRANTRSHIIDLPGQNRVIRRIDFRYGNLPGPGQARVSVWAS